MKEKLNKELKWIDREIDRFEGRIQDTLTEIQKDVATGNIDKIIASKHNIERLEKYQQHLEDLQDRKESLLDILGD